MRKRPYYKNRKRRRRLRFIGKKIYNVFNWEIGARDLPKCPQRKVFFIRLLKKKKANVLNVFLSMCRNQRCFLSNLRMGILTNVEKMYITAVIRDILPIHAKYSGHITKSFYDHEAEKRKVSLIRIPSFAIKLFVKHKKMFNTLRIRTKQTMLYNLVINLTPTRLHKMFSTTKYVLLLRYRLLLPYLYGGKAYSGFEWLRISPFSYRRRACLVYETSKSSSNVVLRDYWFRKNTLYLP